MNTKPNVWYVKSSIMNKNCPKRNDADDRKSCRCNDHFSTTEKNVCANCNHYVNFKIKNRIDTDSQRYDIDNTSMKKFIALIGCEKNKIIGGMYHGNQMLIEIGKISTLGFIVEAKPEKKVRKRKRIVK